MLEEIRIRGLGVIEDAVLDLAPGLTVVTGETGAGKTMVVTGLALLLGGRADTGAVRTGATAAVVEGRIVIDAASEVARRARESGALLDDDVLVVSRSVSAEGRSRAHLGGRAVPVALLAELGDHLVAVHGQSDQRRLLHPARQRAALDRFAGPDLAEPMGRYQRGYSRLAALEGELSEITGLRRERAQEADLLRFGLAEVERCRPLPGEDGELVAEESRLGHADALRGAAEAAHSALAGSLDTSEDRADALTLLGGARRGLEQVRDHDAALALLGDRVAEAGFLVADVASDLASYAASLDTDPARLAAIGERRAQLGALTRKYGPTVDDVLAWAGRARLRVEDLGDDDARHTALTTERDRLRESLALDAAAITAVRQSAAERFAAAVCAELADLAMPHAILSIAVDQRESAEGLRVGARVLAFGPTGVDEVELLLEPHLGAPPRPLQRGASGGELSRIMLALEVVFAGADPVPTFVFDEVDAGVGGRAAVEIGRRLARLAESAQVLVVTHLPQVAAYADRHLLVAKSDDGSVTISGVTTLDAAGRVRELSRMLAGQEDSTSARAHAEELLEAARTRS